jgi:hypothetical protein
MKTRTHTILFGTACPSFEDWAKTSDIPYETEVGAYVVDCYDVTHCKTPSPYLSELQQAFKDNPDFDRITLDVV